MGYKFFAVQYLYRRYECYTSSDGGQTYAKYGNTTGCKNGKGGIFVMNVYEIRESDTIFSLGFGDLDLLHQINRDQQKSTESNSF